MSKSYFIWPKKNPSQLLASLARPCAVSYVEDVLREMFPSGYPVVCSSGRAAIALALTQTGLGRGDFLGMFPYASHCVLDAVSRQVTPLSGSMPRNDVLRLVYHQWAFVQETGLLPDTIEDCVDTLCRVDTTLFPGGGRFEIWSLTKILGTSSGGVLWCRDQETAQAIRRIRDSRGGGFCLWLMRLSGEYFPSARWCWQGAEADHGCISSFQAGEILRAIRSWDFIFNDRLQKLNLAWPRCVNWLQKPTNRLPPVVPVESSLTTSAVTSMGISSSYRMFERVEQGSIRSLERVLPIPIHQDVPEEWLEAVLNMLTSREQGQSDE